MDLSSQRKTPETGSKIRRLEKVVAKKEMHQSDDKTEDKLANVDNRGCRSQSLQPFYPSLIFHSSFRKLTICGLEI